MHLKLDTKKLREKEFEILINAFMKGNGDR